MDDCKNCAERCPKSEMAHEIAKGRMYATNEFVSLLKKIESGQLAVVVRCINCKYHDGDLTDEGRYFIFCTKLTLFESAEVPPNFFCGLGEPEVSDNGKV